ncbi:MAG TPA: 5-(carboxyamino)imidazole ribonucleotide synthase [Gemmatimonadaceae bacterium]|nr:5-(carboxyamino)imidazole ribonucleotide synthase [Gemmatimonadaceae bacterium]
MSIIAPGSTIGILGGGQLGRMAAMAARTMGYGVHVLDPDGECAAGAVADRVVAAKFDDADAAADLARNCDVVTLEIEQIGTNALEAASRYAPVRPGASVLGVVQDRERQKLWLSKNGFPIGDYRHVTAVDELRAAVEAFGPTFMKACHGGYDGRSQVRLSSAADVDDAWTSMGGRHSVAERALDLEAELSIMVARRPSGDVSVYPPALNHHERQILAWSVIPAPLPKRVVREADEIGRGIAEAFALEGILAVELFLLKDGTLLVNELAPRPHNSFHETEVACSTSQFEQLVRAVCDLPLGDPRALRPGAIYNLFGDLWLAGTPHFELALAHRGVRLHLYGKRGARPGRKMGHLSATGDTADDALQRVRAAAAAIGADRSLVS